MATRPETLAAYERFRVQAVRLRGRFVQEFATVWPGAQALTSRRLREAWLMQAAALIRIWRPVFRRQAQLTYREVAELDTGAIPTVAASAGATPAIAAGELLGSMLENAFKPITRLARQAQSIGVNPATRLDRADPEILARAAEGAARLALNAGRDYVIQTVEQDRLAVGWMRVTDGDPCAFCLVLASRGPVYKSRTTAEFLAHDNCGCVAVPVFTRDPVLPESTLQAQRIYREAQEWARSTGSQSRGTANDLLNNVRRYQAHLGREAA